VHPRCSNLNVSCSSIGVFAAFFANALGWSREIREAVRYILRGCIGLLLEASTDHRQKAWPTPFMLAEICDQSTGGSNFAEIVAFMSIDLVPLGKATNLASFIGIKSILVSVAKVLPTPRPQPLDLIRQRTGRHGKVTSSTPKRVRGMQRSHSLEGQKTSAAVEFGSASGVALLSSYQLSLDFHSLMT
jgi:hypothetical protein